MMNPKVDNPVGTESLLESDVKQNNKDEQRKAIKWFVDRVKKKSKETQNKADKTLTIGHMYLYRYDPKTKAKLPYYDTSPLVIPVSYYPDGFLGLNLHYIPVQMRRLLLKLMIQKFGKGDNELQYMKFSYEMLGSLSRTKTFAPCVKRYLYSHMQSMYQRIPPSEWANAVMLPTARWVGASASTVYKQSRSKI